MNSKIVAACLLLAFAITSSQAAKPNNALNVKYLCRSRPDGFQAIVPGVCDQYYECLGGKTQLKTCPRFYDFTKKQCVYNNPGCVPTDTKARDNKHPCSGISDGGYAVDPKNPAVYYLCKNNDKENTLQCKDGQEFDLVKLVCAEPSTNSNKPCVTTKAPCTTTKAPCITTTCSTTKAPCTTTTCTTTTCTTTTCTTTTCTTTTCTTTTCTTTTCTTTTCTTTTCTTTTCTTTTCTTTTCTTTPCTTTTCTTTTCTTTPCTTTTTPCTTTTTPCTTTTCITTPPPC
ncbi:integumentary mucin C.1-like [Calliphora vicina]|uniref:integumentary mucin C.1-like n=1 Tax=Calliphora vicina TaxID=7373 RepID=UPI00325BCF7E